MWRCSTRIMNQPMADTLWANEQKREQRVNLVLKPHHAAGRVLLAEKRLTLMSDHSLGRHQSRKPIIEQMTQFISMKLQRHNTYSPWYDNNVVPLIHDIVQSCVYIENNYDHFMEVVYISVVAWRRGLMVSKWETWIHLQVNNLCKLDVYVDVCLASVPVYKYRCRLKFYMRSGRVTQCPHALPLYHIISILCFHNLGSYSSLIPVNTTHE
jgi:hypothetical protein